ncbi:oocyte-secreted protein 3-like [Neofelis nebulosa]|uniref:oocyte-secreted protein 3-like n=1 Tax=Neofelis nebulosa TaxID=61452 RepID=UPI00272AA2FB|nr:oocyte-secreted protein 3-like [Neofelis nebulosa]
MKAYVGLGGWLLLLASLIWTCSGQEPVLVECSRLNFLVVVKRALFYRDELVGPDELFLGTGCQAIRVWPDKLEFDYPVSLCGITTQVFCDGVVFHSWLTYVPKNQSISAKLHLECTVPSSCVSPDESYNNTEVSNGFLLSSPVQHWFLIQYRYCMRCGYTHWREHWSTPFYGPHNYSLQEHFFHPFTDDF